MFPKDPIILFSMVNMWLRDKYSSFDDMEDDMGDDALEIKDILEKAGYKYDISVNCFVER